METKQQELDKLAQDTEGKRAEIEAKYVILDQMAGIIEGYEPPSIHYGQLYGSNGSIHFRGCDYESIRKGKSPDRDLLAALLKAFPPQPKVQVRDGCLSYRPAVKEWKGELLDVCPITVHVEVFQGLTATYEWFARLCTAPAWVRDHGIAQECLDELWRFEVTFPLGRTELGSVRTEVERDKYGTIMRYTRCEFLPNYDKPLDAQVVKWASGGMQYPNSFELWWDVDGGKEVDFPATVKEVL